jgi:protein TonB
MLPAAIASDALPVAAPAVIASPAAATPRFVITVGATMRTLGEAGAIDSGVGAAGSGVAAEPLPEAAVDTAARLLAGSSASYTREAAAAGVEADVPLEIVVNGVGAVTAARVLTHVGYGLDEAALRGVRAYRFAPARRAGRALAVRMRWLMRFQLR